MAVSYIARIYSAVSLLLLLLGSVPTIWVIICMAPSNSFTKNRTFSKEAGADLTAFAMMDESISQESHIAMWLTPNSITGDATILIGLS